MTMDYLPEKMVVMGSGAIGTEFSYIYHSLGTKVTLVEYLDRIVPNEDKEVSKELQKVFSRKGIEVKTSTKGRSGNKNRKRQNRSR